MAKRNPPPKSNGGKGSVRRPANTPPEVDTVEEIWKRNSNESLASLFAALAKEVEHQHDIAQAIAFAGSRAADRGDDTDFTLKHLFDGLTEFLSDMHAWYDIQALVNEAFHRLGVKEENHE